MLQIYHLVVEYYANYSGCLMLEFFTYVVIESFENCLVVEFVKTIWLLNFGKFIIWLLNVRTGSLNVRAIIWQTHNMISCQVIGWCITIRVFFCTWVSNTFLRNTNNSLLLDYNRRVCGNFLLMYFLNKVYFDYRYWSRFIFQRPQKHKGQGLLNVECQSHYLSISDHNTES